MSNLCPTCGLPSGRDAGECDPFPLDGGMACLTRALAAKDAEIASLKAELAETQHEVKRREHIKIKDDRHFERMQATHDRLIADLAALRAVVMGLPWYRNCSCPATLTWGATDCEHDTSNAALAAAKKMAGGE